jgi:hypothetical protein
MVNPTIVNAYLARYSRAQIEAALDKALANHANGVMVTSLSFEGGSSSGQMTGNTENLIETFTECLRVLDSGETTAPERQAFIPAVFPAPGRFDTRL